MSGLHVDPGFTGRLVFSVFNAGPGEVHLQRCEECFHIWFANLRYHEPTGPKIGYQNITSEIINQISGEIQSFAGLDAKITETDKRPAEKMTAIEREQAVIEWAAALLVGAALTLSLRECSFGRPAVPAALPPATSTLAPVPIPFAPPVPTVLTPPTGSATAPAAPAR